MVRLTSFAAAAALAFAGCGKDSVPAVDGGIVTPSPDAAGGTIDAAPTATTDAGLDAQIDAACAEATTHSDLAWIQANVFTPSCASSGCHDDVDPEVGLVLTDGNSYNNLVNKGSSTVQGWTRVVPGSLETSYLIVALGRTPGPPPRDGFMPINEDPLCVEKLEAIERWVAAGAPQQ